MAKTPAERKREQREREAMTEEERLSRLLSRTIELHLFKGTDNALQRCMSRTGIDEAEDLVTRLIHNADRLTDARLLKLTEKP